MKILSVSIYFCAIKMPSKNFSTVSGARLPKIPLSDISFEHLAANHDTLSFFCTHQALTDYLTIDVLKKMPMSL